MPRVYVAAGSNIEPLKNLSVATAELARQFPDLESSPWYRNRAVGFEGDDFINLVVTFTTELPVGEVAECLAAVETLCGRPSGAARWAPRSMDLDMLLYGDLVSDGPPRRLPRPELLKRPFMLRPLADLAPDLVHPTEGVTIGELWRRFDGDAHPMTPVPPGFTSPCSDLRRRAEPGR